MAAGHLHHPDTSADPDTAREIGQIFDRTLPRVYGYILIRVSGHTPTAEDLTSETYLAFTASWPARRDVVPDPLAWLLTIARNKVIDYYRSQSSRPVNIADWNTLPEPAPEIDVDLARIADQDELYRLLVPLNPEARIVLLLRYLDGFPVREIADLLGKSEHAIESILARAKRAIRTAVQNQETHR